MQLSNATIAGARRRFALAPLLAGLLLLTAGRAAAADDMAPADGNAEPLVGVGLVIGLPGTGDSVVDSDFVQSSIVGILKSAGLEPWKDEIKPGRVAMVMLSAELPRDAGDGAVIDVDVRALGNAKSLAGGTLLVAPLRDAAGIVHAVGQGAIAGDARGGRLVPGATIERQEQAVRREYASLP
jgi:flagellar P-ring protein precursor FlgI